MMKTVFGKALIVIGMIMSIPICAQVIVGNTNIQMVGVDPTGIGCGTYSALLINVNTGLLYSCQSGVYAQVAGGGTGTVTTTGSPAAGNLAEFSGPTSITNGNLSGDCTTSGSLAITCTKSSGVLFGGLATLTETDGNIVYGSGGVWTKGTTLPNGITGSTQSAGDNSTKVATTQYVDAAAGGPGVVSKDTSTPVSVSSTACSGYYNNQNATAATAVTYNLPTAGTCVNGMPKQFCFTNSNNGSAPDTGVLTIATSAAGQFIIFTDGTLSASGGNVTSGGAASDTACVVAVDSTHWQLYTPRGLWTKH